MARIYTRGGDQWTTVLIGGARVPKDHPRLEACGSLDELNAHLGCCRAEVNRCGSDSDMAELRQRLNSGLEFGSSNNI